MATSQPHQPPQGVLDNLKATARFYQTHGAAFTKPLLAPIAQQVVGVYGCLILSYLLIDQTVTRFYDLLGQHPLAIVVAVLPVALGMITLFCRGFWRYMVLMVALCRNVDEVSRNHPPDFQAACRALEPKARAYTGYLLVLVALQALPLVLCGFIIALAAALGSVLGQGGTLFVLVGGGLLATLLFVLTGVVTLYFSLGFQVLAFEEAPGGLESIPRRSFALVRGHFWPVAALQLIWMVITTALIPFLLTVLLGVSGLMGGLNSFHGWVLDLLLNQAQPLGGGLDPIPNYEMIYDLANANRAILAEALSSSFISAVVPMLLLPLGTASFTYFYQSRMVQADASIYKKQAA